MPDRLHGATMEQLRCYVGEDSAWVHMGLREQDRVEVVAFGFKVAERIIWRFVRNTVEHDAHRRFQINGADVKAVIADVLKAHGPDAQMFALWHSHYDNVDPSKMDVEFFPGYLVEVGVVYHAPTGTTTAYDADGVISSTMAFQASSLRDSTWAK